MVRYRGWPFFFQYTNRVWGNERLLESLGTIATEKLKALDTEYRWLPWTHQTYRLLDANSWFEWNMFGGFSIWLAILDALFALTLLFPILFLQIPRRPVATRPPNTAGKDEKPGSGK